MGESGLEAYGELFEATREDCEVGPRSPTLTLSLTLSLSLSLSLSLTLTLSRTARAPAQWTPTWAGSSARWVC